MNKVNKVLLGFCLGTSTALILCLIIQIWASYKKAKRDKK